MSANEWIFWKAVHNSYRKKASGATPGTTFDQRAERKGTIEHWGRFTTSPRDVNSLHTQKSPTVLSLSHASYVGQFYICVVAYRHTRVCKLMGNCRNAYVFERLLVISEFILVARIATCLPLRHDLVWICNDRNGGPMIAPERTDWMPLGSRAPVCVDSPTVVHCRLARTSVSSVTKAIACQLFWREKVLAWTPGSKRAILSYSNNSTCTPRLRSLAWSPLRVTQNKSCSVQMILRSIRPLETLDKRCRNRP